MFRLVVSFQRYGGISVGGVNSQVRLTEEKIESTFSDLQNLFASYRVCKQYIINITGIKIIVFINCQDKLITLQISFHCQATVLMSQNQLLLIDTLCKRCVEPSLVGHLERFRGQPSWDEMFCKQVGACRRKIHPLPIPFTCKWPGQSFILSLKLAELMEFTASTAVVQLPNSYFACIHTTQIVTAWCIFFSLPAPNGEAGFVSEEVVEELIFFFPPVKATVCHSSFSGASGS